MIAVSCPVYGFRGCVSVFVQIRCTVQRSNAGRIRLCIASEPCNLYTPVMPFRLPCLYVRHYADVPSSVPSGLIKRGP